MIEKTDSTDERDTITRPGIDEVYGSLNWFDEQEISTHLKVDVHTLMEEFVNSEGGLSPLLSITRICEFVRVMREGTKPAIAAAKIHRLTAKDLNDIGSAYLAAEDDDDLEGGDVVEEGPSGKAADDELLTYADALPGERSDDEATSS